MRKAVCAVLTVEGVRSAEISLALTDDAEIHRINREFLSHDYPTDVLSFSLSAEEYPLVPVGERGLLRQTEPNARRNRCKAN